MKMKKFICAACIFTLIFATACKSKNNPEIISDTIAGPLDTVSTVSLYEWNGGKEPIDEIFNMLEDIDKRMSAVSENSEIFALSEQIGFPVKVSEDIFYLIDYAKKVSMETDGAFDITVRPIMNLWGIGTENARIPEQQELNEALKSIGYNAVILDENLGSVTLGKENMRLDLGAIAKGYACEQAVGILKKYGVKHAVVDLGGNVYVHGAKPDGSKWKVGVKSPLSGESGYFCVLKLTDCAVVTSGVYERFFEKNGEFYHHIMNPKTGFPVENGLISVTVICESPTLGDALSTACFVLGTERGFEYAQSKGADVIFVSNDFTVRITPGLSEIFEISDERFKLVELR